MGSLQYDIIIAYQSVGSPDAKIGHLNQKLAHTERGARKVSDEFAGIGTAVGNIAGSSLGALGASLTSVGGIASSLASTIAAASIGVAALATGALTAGLAAGVKVNEQMELLQSSLASTFSAQYGIKDFNTALSTADQTIKTMRKDAASLPGTFDDLAGIFQTIAPMGANLGMNIGDVEKMSAKAMAAGKASGLGAPIIGRELSLLMSGHGTSTNLLGTRLGLDMRKLNAMNGTDRVKTINDSLSRYDQGIAHFGKTFEALSTTFTSNSKQLLGALASPAFDRIKDVLAEANGWWSKNEASALSMAHNFGSALVGYFDRAASVLAGFEEPLFNMTKNLDGSKVKTVARQGAEFLGAASIAKLALPMIASHAGNVGSAAGSIGNALGGPGLGKLAELGGDFQVGLISAVEFGLAITTLAGILHSATDASSMFHDSTIQSLHSLYSTGTSIFDNLSRSMEPIEAVAWGVADALGSGLLGALDNVAQKLAPITSMWTSFTDEASRAYYALTPMMTEGMVGKNARGALSDTKWDEAAGAPKVINHVTNIAHQTNTISIEGKQDDPNRLARLVVEATKRAAETPTKSRKPNIFSEIGRP